MPITLIILCLQDILFEKFVKKLRRRYPLIFCELVTLHAVISILCVVFVTCFTAFLSAPVEATWLGLVAAAIYFVLWLASTLVFCFLMPGMCDNAN